jgi:hypothetical protein
VTYGTNKAREVMADLGAAGVTQESLLAALLDAAFLAGKLEAVTEIANSRRAAIEMREVLDRVAGDSRK